MSDTKTTPLFKTAGGEPLTDGEPLTFRLQILVRMRGNKRRYETWERTLPAIPSSQITEANFKPFQLEKKIDLLGGGVSIKREQFALESWDPDKRVATFKESSFARSEWFYQNIQNFGFTCTEFRDNWKKQ